MRVLTRFALVGLAGALAAGSLAQITPNGRAFLLRAKYTKGRTVRYSVRSAADMKGMKVSVVVEMTERVTNVSSGIGSIEVSTGKSQIMMNGKPFGQPTPIDNKKGAIRLDSLGRSVDGSGASLQTHLQLPKAPIRVGETWSTAGVASVPGQMEQQDIAVTYRFLGMTKLNGQRAAKLGVTMKGSGTATLSGSGTAWISADDCSLVKETATIHANSRQIQIPVNLLITRG